MRITLTIENDAFAIAQAYARARGIKLGQAISALIHIGGTAKVSIRQMNGVWVFDLPPGTPVVTAERVRQLLN